MFGKIITAIVTPFDENKNIDYRAFGTLLKKSLLVWAQIIQPKPLNKSKF